MEGEISLRELIEILLKRKNLIIGITLAFLIVCFVVSYLVLTPIYEANADLRVAPQRVDVRPAQQASILAAHQLKDDDKIITAILEEYLRSAQIEGLFEESISNLAPSAGYDQNEFRQIVTMSEDIDDGILTITVRGTDPTEVAQITNAAAAEFINFSFEAQERRLVRAMVSREEQLASIEEELEEVLEELEGLEDAERWFGHLEQEAVAYGEEKAQLKLTLLDLASEMTLLEQAQPFTLMRPAAVPTTPVSPRRSLNLALSIVLGLMVGTFLAFFQEYWQASDPSKARGVGDGPTVIAKD